MEVFLNSMLFKVMAGLMIVAIIGMYIWWRYFHSPIAFERKLYGRKSRWGITVYSLGITIVSVFIIWLLARIFGIEENTVISNNSTAQNAIWAIICQFLDPGNVSLATGTGPNIIALLSAVAGVVCLSGLFVSSVVNYVNKRSEQWAQGLRYYKHGLGRYIVIIGVNEQTATIVRKALAREDKIDHVLIQTSQDVPQVRERLELALNIEEEKQMVIYSGERTSMEDITKLRLNQAVEVYILGEDMYIDTEKDHDAYNMNCLRLITDYMRSQTESNQPSQKKDKLTCHVNFEYQSTYTMFKSTDVYRNLGEYIDFLPFNIHEIWSKKIFVDNYAVIPKGKGQNSTVQEYLPLDGQGITRDSLQTVHLFIFGMNQMGTALGVQAALLCHFPNFVTNPQLRTRITFIDYKAVSEGEYFMGRFSTLFDLSRHRTCIVGQDNLLDDSQWVDPMTNPKGLYHYMGDNFMDIEWEFIQGNAASIEVQQYIQSCLQPNQQQLCTIAVSFNNPQQSVATALYLPEAIVMSPNLLQILVYQQNSFDIIDNVSDQEQIWKRYTKLRPFGMIEDSYNGDVFDEPAAKWMNYLYVTAKKNKQKETHLTPAICKEIERLWAELNMVDKLSNLDLADSFGFKLRSQGKTLDEDTLKAMSWSEHNRWVTERLILGFRPPYAEEYDTFIHCDSAQSASKRTSWKETQHIHVCICSNERLKKIDPNSHANDERVVRNIAQMRQRALELRVRHIQQTSATNSVENMFLNRFVPVPEQHFWIMDCPVTQGLWKKVMGTRGMIAPAKKNDHLPVVNVSWYDVQSFIRVLNKLTGLHFALPTVEQWRTAYHKLHQSPHIWNKQTSNNRLHPVRPSQPNYVYDMMGNVWEWMQDKYDTTCYYLYGGSYRFSDHYNALKDEVKNDECVSYRMPYFAAEDIGFRLVVSADFEKNIESVATNEPTCMQQQCFVEVKAGSFMMGAFPNDKHAKRDEKTEKGTQTKREISKFYMSDVPVTQQLWKEIMGTNPSHFQGDNLPVENVTWDDTQHFLKALNAQLTDAIATQIGIVRCQDYEFRLPTEAEWEYAARGGHQQQDLLYSGSNDPDEVAWHHGLTNATHEVKRKKPNILGLYDMSGNVWEWCNDWYLKTMYDEGRVKDPVATKTGSAKVYRGGSWSCAPEDCRATRTTYWVPNLKASDIGFRIVYAPKITEYEKYD